MITYVNTVLVGTGNGALTSGPVAQTSDGVGAYCVVDNHGSKVTASNAGSVEMIKVGLVTNKMTTSANSGNPMPVTKWSNWIKKNDIKSYTYTAHADDTEDTVTLDFTGITSAASIQNKRIVVRLTFKDLPTRYRKWTESYEVQTTASETTTTLATKIYQKINKEAKRARVIASNETAGKVVLTAMTYTDDNAVDTINVYNKVRFSANAWMTDPSLAGFASKNKYSIDGLKITKVPGKTYVASAKLVRDMEAQAMGYEGVLNRGEGVWPIIKPGMNTDLSKKYDTITLEFENSYRSADDLNRRTKQTLQIFDQISDGGTSHLSALKAILDTFVKGEHSDVKLATSDAE